jgi:hypothetical protein
MVNLFSGRPVDVQTRRADVHHRIDQLTRSCRWFNPLMKLVKRAPPSPLISPLHDSLNLATGGAPRGRPRCTQARDLLEEAGDTCRGPVDASAIPRSAAAVQPPVPWTAHRVCWTDVGSSLATAFFFGEGQSSHRISFLVRRVNSILAAPLHCSLSGPTCRETQHSCRRRANEGAAYLHQGLKAVVGSSCVQQGCRFSLPLRPRPHTALLCGWVELTPPCSMRV